MTTYTVSWDEGLVDGLTLGEAEDLAAELVEMGRTNVIVDELGLKLGARLEAAARKE